MRMSIRRRQSLSNADGPGFLQQPYEPNIGRSNYILKKHKHISLCNK
jgi:hypothetical protein